MTKQPTTMRQLRERGQGEGRMKKRIRGMTFASRGEKERKRKREDEMDAVECASGKMVQAREKHCIDITERINEEGGGLFRACGNSFVRKTKGDARDI
ncbi:hypothetical protein ALC53_11464 [Atta colombica]|uniref:Uncharacterized protein n=1 Tax=Atta colombica TaxID=520822 RepID=A0A195B128_9HYME|nr:hypothetical protein ALC53_11464 [Atta colombica]